MSFWDEWEKRKKRRAFFFPDIERMIDEMEKEMAEIIKDLKSDIPEDLTKEQRLPDGSIRKEYGPFVYGYSVKIGPDGKPIVHEFGNMKPNIDDETKKPVSLQDTREPLIDIIDEPERIKVIAELPGVDKEDINLTATERSLIIDVNNPIRKYHKELEFPVDVDEVSATSSYKNGVLETVIQKKREKGKGRTVTIY